MLQDDLNTGEKIEKQGKTREGGGGMKNELNL
jgi:hypothetical protein